MGNSGCNIDHGSFFSYYNQTYFASGGMDNTSRFLRASFLAPCHYRESGDIVVDQKIMEYGCGQYSASWDRIDASWYFAASRECKKECLDGSFSVVMKKGEYLYFPNVAGVTENAVFRVMAGGGDETVLRIYDGMPDFVTGDTQNTTQESKSLPGELIGNCVIGEKETIYETVLSCTVGKNRCIWWRTGPWK